MSYRRRYSTDVRGDDPVSPAFFLAALAMEGQFMRAFFIGLQFLTRLSIIRQDHWTEEDFGRSVKFFPLIGAVLGMIYAAAAYVFLIFLPSKGIILPPHTISAVLLILPPLLTGGLHCDGFMDTMDGLFSGRSRERMLEIMKDSRVGANGVFAFVLLMILDWSILLDLTQTSVLIPALLFMPVVARLMMVVAIALFPYARPEGMGKAFKDGGTKPVLYGVFFYTLLISFLLSVAAEFCGIIPLGAGILSSWLFFVAAVILAALFFTIFFADYATRHLGGLTGDVYGAITTLTETLVLLCFLLLTSFV